VSEPSQLSWCSELCAALRVTRCWAVCGQVPLRRASRSALDIQKNTDTCLKYVGAVAEGASP
jgi:hypothetical protein